MSHSGGFFSFFPDCGGGLEYLYIYICVSIYYFLSSFRFRKEEKYKTRTGNSSHQIGGKKKHYDFLILYIQLDINWSDEVLYLIRFFYGYIGREREPLEEGISLSVMCLCEFVWVRITPVRVFFSLSLSALLSLFIPFSLLIFVTVLAAKYVERLFK